MSATVESTTRSPWVLLPPCGSVDPHAWAAEVADQVTPTDSAAADSVRVLTHYQGLETLDGFAARLLFAPHLPEAALVSIAAVEAGPNSIWDQRNLLGLDRLGEFSGQLDDLRVVGIEGFQLLKVDQVEVDEAPDVAVFTSTLMTVVRRRLSRGPVDVVALSRSADLVLVAAAIEPVVELLLGEDLALLLGG